ncbi:protein trichome birefringence-like 13 [Phragmites australis]|uniref:protein trichome birefringence-like 13 n=1 Tax=Phragmites australis TaxID=29695 RepID=UPI002D76CC5F|nr:protein trichome birefringence-like 13 [Phragmites australis]
MPPARSPAAGLGRRGVPLLLLLPLILLLHLTSSPRALPALRRPSQACDYSAGEWLPDASAGLSLRYDHTCREIFKGWNCVANGKANGRALLRWRWRPSSGCELPRLDPLRFLEGHRDTNIGFVGDSLNRNMFVSLVCMLRGVSRDVRKWRPAGADRGFTFLRYNLTVAYHRTNLLVRYSRWSASPNGGPLESLGYKQGYRVDVDVTDQTWAEASSFHDILIFNTGHWWWAPSKFDPIQSPMLFFEKGKPIIPPLLPPAGLDLALQHMITFVNKTMRPNAVKFFRTQSPRHFEGGDWNEGGSCQRNQPLSSEEVEEIFSLDNNGTNVEVRLVNQHLMKALRQSTFRVLDITRMSEFRADAHPSTTGGKKHDDCMHWCLPGPTDTWNDLLAANLEDVES